MSKADRKIFETKTNDDFAPSKFSFSSDTPLKKTTMMYGSTPAPAEREVLRLLTKTSYNLIYSNFRTVFSVAD